MFPRIAVLLLLAAGSLPASAAAQSIADDNPAATSPEPGKFVVSARAADGTIVVRQLETGSGQWSDWSAVRGQKATSGPALTHDRDGVVRLFARGEDGKSLIANTGSVDAWAGWSQPVRGQLISGPGVSRRRDTSRVDVMVLGTDGMYNAGQAKPGAPFDPFRKVVVGEKKTPVSGTHAPGVASSTAGSLNVFVRQGDGTITELWSAGSGWGTASRGATAVSAVAAVSRWNKTLRIFYRGRNG